MDEQNLDSMENSIRVLKEALLINSLTNVVNSPLYSDEARKEAAIRVESLLGLSKVKDFEIRSEQDLPNNVIR